MLSKSFLADMSRRIGIGHEGIEDGGDDSFAGLNMIRCGDLHQFPPIADRRAEYLYMPTNILRNTVEEQVGRKTYEEFTTVVILKQQIRVIDRKWLEMLRRLRVSMISQDQVQMIRELIVTTPGGHANFEEEPWKSAILVTPRHAVRTTWNAAGVHKWCKDTREVLFICKAEDCIGAREPTMAERCVCNMCTSRGSF
jgi:hypothetical protein